MNILRISLCTMLLVSPIPSLVLPVSVAQAETPVFVGGLQDLLPGEPSIADGSTQATYYFVLLNADGSPMEGVSGKTSLGSAKGTLKSEGNGLYSTILTPKPSHLQPMTLFKSMRELQIEKLSRKVSPFD